MNILYQEAIRLLEEKKNFAYATIISQDGSTPRSAGAKMLILEDGIVGTIGGGLMEAMVIDLARKEVMNNKQPRVEYYDLSPQEAAVSEFICGGNNEILIAYIDAEKEDSLQVFRAAGHAEENGLEAWFVYAIDSRAEAELPFQICVSISGEGMIGSINGDAEMAEDIAKSPIRLAIHGETTDGVRYVADPIHSGGVLYLFGGGHVSKEVAAYARTLEFRVVVIDDREEYANIDRFPGCEVVVVEDFENLPAFPVDQSSYIVIITRGHVHDYTVLSWAVKTNASYIGMIGSKKKRDIIYDRLRAEGTSEEKIASIHSPIGLTIGAETPAEIGISIAAELIAHRHQK